MIYAKVAAGVLVLAALIGLGWWLGSAHWKTQYEALQAADWKGQYQRQKDVSDDLQKKLDDVQATIKRNAAIIGDLNAKLQTTDSDHEHLVGQLRNALTQASRPSCNPMPTAPNQPRTSAAAQTPSVGQAAVLPKYIADAVIECRGNVLTGNALLQQLTPQLKVSP